jgi:hypothetical protein
VLAKEQRRPSWLRVDAQNLYWVLDAAGTGAIMKMPVGGGPATTLVSDIVQPDSLQVDGTSAYWLAYGPQAGIHKASLTGGPALDLVSAGAPVPIRQIAVYEGDTYYSNAPAGAVMKVRNDGTGAPTTLASGLGGPTSLAVDGSGVYVAETGDSGAIAWIPNGGGAPMRLATGQPAPHAVALTSDEVFWVDDGAFDVATGATVGAAIMKIAKSGGSPRQVVSASGVTALMVDGSFLYYCLADAVMRAPLAGGAPIVFAPNQREPRSLASDAKHIYWASSGTPDRMYADGDVRRLAK